MDANTKDVLMALIALISAIVTPLVVVYVNRQTNKKVDANQAEMVDKVDGYHKEVNGNMAKLLKTTADLATANEKAKNKEQRK